MVSAVEEDLDPRIRFEIVINHLKPCSRIPSITAWEGMHNSKYDFQAHPISIYGMRAIVHEKPDDRKSWENHGVEGFYLGPAINHYRCWDFYIPKTQRVRFSDTVQWLPHAFQLPGSSPIHRFEAAFDDLRTAITDLKNSNVISVFERQPASSDATTAMSKIRLLDNMMNPQQVQRVLPTVTTTPAVSTSAPQRVLTLPEGNDDKHPDDVKWETVHFNKLPKVAQNFFSKVGDTYTDKTDTPPVIWKVIAVTKNAIRTHKVGSAIQWYYRTYDTSKYKTTPLDIDDCEHISCDEIYKSNNVTWKGLSHVKAPTRQRTFAPNPVQIRGSTSKSRRSQSQANVAMQLDTDTEHLNTILEFRQSLHPITGPSSNSGFIEANALSIEATYDPDLPPLNLTPGSRKLTYSNALKDPTMEE